MAETSTEETNSSLSSSSSSSSSSENFDCETLDQTPSTQQYFELTARIKNPDDTFGLCFDPNMVVNQVLKTSPFYDKVQILDTLTAVSGQAVTSEEQYYHLISQSCNKDVNLLMYRPIVESTSDQNRIQMSGISKDRQKRYPTDRFLLITLVYRLGLPFGTRFTELNGVIAVERVEPHSLVFQRLQTGDIVLDVDGNETRSVLELKSFIYAGFRIRGACQLLVQRQDMNAKRIISPTIPKQKELTILQYRLPDEICEIGSKLAEKYVRISEKQIPGILVNDEKSLSTEELDVSFIEKVQVINVGVEFNQ